ncbi:class I SAM-dependent methyltransferase [Streptomyces sp. SID11385]|uniref:class I SAM-dependent DNA methyltransferase n=1 Tax=Streptomyces sp. SID11385 TaxID=2706031 RepID=UPI0013C9C7E6|nr:class I SAM-dependent methyltransferase [Streptomyces sp. SID11385]NEA42863.1 class I SAM-dependent methyltransferase [Streptomyces sp. SID11385]
MTELASLPATRTAYDALASVYAEQFSDSLREFPLERALLSAFAELVRAGGDGEVADLGCGPGYVTAHLCGLGLRAFGVDASPAMIGLARKAHPEPRFEVGSMAALGLADGALGGVLSRWSLIHTPPSEVPSVLDEFARVLAPGGYLLLSLAATDGPEHETQSYDHAVTTAYRWSPDRLAALLAERGLHQSARTVIEPRPADKRQFQTLHLLARKA